MRIFDEGERPNHSLAEHGESLADYINRASAPLWQDVRDLLEDWFSRVNPASQGEIRQRLRESDNAHFIGAFWELYLHEALIRSGYRVTCHPAIVGSRRKPDFLAERDNESFYLEATSVSESPDGIAAQRRLDRVYAAIDAIHSPDFFLWLDVVSEGPNSPPTKRLRTDLTSWIATLDVDSLWARLERGERLESLPLHEWHDGDWQINFRPWPKSPQLRGRPGVRPIGVYDSAKWNFVDGAKPIKKALSDKGKSYGKLDRPFVIALLTSSISTDNFDVLNALYGTEKVAVSADPERPGHRIIRDPDGYWSSPRGWDHVNVSAVLIGRGISPWSIAENIPMAWINPGAEHAWTTPGIWYQAVVENNRVNYIEPSISILDAFGLEPDWPRPDDGTLAPRDETVR